MVTHLTEPINIHTNLLQKEDYYYCPECLIHFAKAPKWCWFCGVIFDNASTFTKIFPRDKTK